MALRAPNLLRRFDEQPQLGDLVVDGDHIALDDAGEAAWRADSKVVAIHESACLLDAASDRPCTRVSVAWW